MRLPKQNQNDTEILKTVELWVIKNTYKKLIMCNPILKSDFYKLAKTIENSGEDSAKSYKRIIDHLIAEVSEIIEDDQRMDDESPSLSLKNDKNLKEYLKLKRDIESYNLTYLSKLNSPK
jgi:hypothetical protein